MVSLLCLMEQSRFDTDAADRAHLLARSLARRPGILPTGASPLGTKGKGSFINYVDKTGR